jgi:hypothetical protein
MAPTAKQPPGPRGTGHIYVATTDAHPGMVKIGFTTQSPEKRIQQFATGSPQPFRLAYSASVTNPRKVEQAVHSSLDRFRVNDQREFFYVTIKQAVAAIHYVSEEVRYHDALVEAQAMLKAKEEWLLGNVVFLRRRLPLRIQIAGVLIALLIPATNLAILSGFSMHLTGNGLGALFGWLLGALLFPIGWVVAAIIATGFDVLTNRHELGLLAAALARQHRLKPEDLPLPKDGLLRLLL